MRLLPVSLTARLTAVLLVLLGVVGAVSLALTLRTAHVHASQVRQQLNREVASHIAKDLRPFRDGAVDKDALKALFMDAMRINPSLEVYLLDGDGRILAYDAPPERIVRDRVDLTPVRRFLEAPADELVVGDDPRDADGRKVFSAHPVQQAGGPAAWLYIIVGGEEYDSIAALLEASWIHRASAWWVAMSLLVAGAVGLAAFAFLTRPLRRLRAAMVAFREGDAQARVDVTSRDEIGELAATFNAMADRIVRQIRHIRQDDERRRELVAAISHDLRTPIASLQGFLETKLMKEGELSRERHIRYTESALRASRRLSQLVDDLFELSRLDAGDVTPSLETFCLRELAEDVVQEMSLQARDKGLQLRVDAPDTLPSVRGDIGLIERVLENLLSNAIRYTPAGGRVTVRIRPRDDGVELRVVDTGTGIPAEEIPRVFEPFHRVEKSRNEDEGGTGLGLAIAKRILDLHRSPLRVRSEVSVGTSIAFTLAS